MTHRSRLAAGIAAVVLFASQTFAFENARTTQPSQTNDGTDAAALRATAEMQRIRAARDAYEADRLVERAARLEMHGGHDADIEPLYAKALSLDPTNERARQALASVRERLGLVAAPSSPLLDRTQRELKAKRQEVMYRFEAMLGAAREGIWSAEPDGFRDARLQLDRARLLRAANPTLFSTEEAAELDARIRDHDLAVKRAVQNRDDAIRRAEDRELARRIKDARVHDISLGL